MSTQGAQIQIFQDSGNANIVYICKAPSGAPLDEALWSIVRVDSSVPAAVTIQYPAIPDSELEIGYTDYIFIADDREDLDYY